MKEETGLKEEETGLKLAFKEIEDIEERDEAALDA